MARAVDERTSHQTDAGEREITQNGNETLQTDSKETDVVLNGSITLTGNGKRCENDPNGDCETALLNGINLPDVNTNTNANADSTYSGIPMVTIKPGIMTDNDRATYEISPSKKILKLSDEKPSRNSDVAPLTTWRLCATITVLLLANILNYMDRYTIAGILPDIINYYNINNSEAGLIQTVFIISYMILSPIFGYMGDRYNRKYIMAAGILFWSFVTLAGSFVPSNYLWAFMFLRGMVGVGEASYSTIAPTIISDLFVGNMRTIALTIFYFAIPVGSGLGYIVGANVAHALGHWQWALRVTPGMGVLCVIGILTIVQEPARGALEGASHLHTTSWTTDLKVLIKNKSFVLSTMGFTCVTFVAGALAFWGVNFIKLSIVVQGDYMAEARISLIFGIITCLAGFFGVGIGTFVARQLRRKITHGDPLVCAFGLIASAPFLYFAIIVSKYNTAITWLLIFIGETFLCLNWAIVTDMLLYIVIPTRRSTAEAVQILVSHAFGDAGSPYLVGAISDVLHGRFSTSTWDPAAEFLSLQYSMYMTCFVCVLGGFFFLLTAIFISQDKAKADRAIKGTAVVADLMSSGDQSILEQSLPNIVANV